MLIRDAINDVLVENGHELPEDGQLLTSSGIDSLEIIQLCMRIEEKLAIEINVMKLDMVKTMADFRELVEAYVRLRGHLPACGNPSKECSCGFSDVFWKDPVLLIPKKFGLCL